MQLDSLQKALYSLSSGLKAYTKRIETAVVNMSNIHSLPSKLGEDPYTRQIVLFKNEIDKSTGAKMIRAHKVIRDTKTPYKKEHIPGHPAADKEGYVTTPNVEFFTEHSEFKEGTRIYGDLSAAYRNITELNRLTIQMIPA